MGMHSLVKGDGTCGCRGAGLQATLTKLAQNPLSPSTMLRRRLQKNHTATVSLNIEMGHQGLGAWLCRTSSLTC